jgi:hypothetical protein
MSGRNILGKTKMELVGTCIKSLELENQNSLHTIAVVDNSTPDYTLFLQSIFDEVVHTSDGFDVGDHRGKWPVFGGTGSHSRLMEFISKQGYHDNDIVLILEDDYLFLSGGLQLWIKACGSIDGFVSPFDHPDRYYRNDDSFFHKTQISLHNGIHFRTVESTTGVVGGRYQFFKKSAFIRKLPRFHVWFFWPERLLGRELPSIDRVFYRRIYLLLKIRLYSPIPGFATHLSQFIPPKNPNLVKKGVVLPKTQLSPGVNWEKRFYDLVG